MECNEERQISSESHNCKNQHSHILSDFKKTCIFKKKFILYQAPDDTGIFVESQWIKVGKKYGGPGFPDFVHAM